jgi:hypothetical protein
LFGDQRGDGAIEKGTEWSAHIFGMIKTFAPIRNSPASIRNSWKCWWDLIDRPSYTPNSEDKRSICTGLDGPTKGCEPRCSRRSVTLSVGFLALFRASKTQGFIMIRRRIAVFGRAMPGSRSFLNSARRLNAAANLGGALAVLVSCVAGTARGDMLTMNNFTSLPTRNPVTDLGAEPWFTAVVSAPGGANGSGATSGTLSLTAGSNWNSPSTDINTWAFNTGIPSTDFTFTFDNASTGTAPTATQLTSPASTGIDSAGNFGIVFRWTTTNFTKGKTVVLDIGVSGSAPVGTTFSASTFKALSTGGAAGKLLSETITSTEDYSGVTVPELSRWVAVSSLIGIGLIGLVWRRRPSAA